MQSYRNEQFVQRFDRDSGALFEDLSFTGCEFNNFDFFTHQVCQPEIHDQTRGFRILHQL